MLLTDKPIGEQTLWYCSSIDRLSQEHCRRYEIPEWKKQDRYNFESFNRFTISHLGRDYDKFLSSVTEIFENTHPDMWMASWRFQPEDYSKLVVGHLLEATDRKFPRFPGFSTLRDKVLKVAKKKVDATRTHFYKAIGALDPNRRLSDSEISFKKYCIDFPAYVNAARVGKCLFSTGPEYNKSEISRHWNLGPPKVSVSGIRETEFFPNAQRISVPTGDSRTAFELSQLSWSTIKAIRREPEFRKNLTELRKIRKEQGYGLYDIASALAKHWRFIIERGISETIKDSGPYRFYAHPRLRRKVKLIERYVRFGEVLGASVGLWQAAAHASYLPPNAVAEILAGPTASLSLFAFDRLSSAETSEMKQARQDLARLTQAIVRGSNKPQR